MSKEQLTVLSQIYNTLLLVETKGENTLIMAECVKALQSLINEGAKELGLTTAPQQTAAEENEKGE